MSGTQLLHLPVELIGLIFTLVPTRPTTPNYTLHDLRDHVVGGRRTLCNLCHTSRLFYSISQPLLYRFTLVESTDRLMLLARTLSAKPDAVSWIQSLAVWTTHLCEAPEIGPDLTTVSSLLKRVFHQRSVPNNKEGGFFLDLPHLPSHLQELDGKITTDVQVIQAMLTEEIPLYGINNSIPPPSSNV